MNTPSTHLDELKKYYGTILKGSADLKTGACCSTDEGLTPAIKAALSNINDGVLSHFYGCGSPLPPLLAGCTVLDLGCGSGRDVYLAAQLVGPGGYVIGVDMTDEQLKIARDNRIWHMARFGYIRPNVDFRQGYMEDLGALGISDDTIDVVISNCVLNLSLDKRSVFGEIFRVLKPGGELFFSDVFSGRRVPERFHADPLLHGECLAGALYSEDFRRLLRDLGCPDYRVTDSRPLALNNPEVERTIGMVDFYSLTIRAFKLPNLEDRCEDYGQVATYHGTIADWPHFFDLDEQYRFITGKPTPVCGNTASILAETRYRDHFAVQGDRSTHFGPFDCVCAPSIRDIANPEGAPHGASADGSGSGGCCC
uniref:Arsenite methyltransferase n=1 Tax=Candidatus Kentrum eta TaxID=2126337 RepID=A0A450VBP9_9GAMM|nr:MAG: Methyltransferase domain-containing protein [Candidatus Kentron sp. H]VFK02255.1 MAG: Methyltransferase domain-containing protein [Candidatus Kentron sp. H]VFK05378.1 MAG: Methyltransferase domain-containing protein [Candidatus Kentron sp. H]